MQSLQQSLKVKAAAELELRRRALSRQDFLSWLKSSESKYCWDYAHVRYIANELDDIASNNRQRHLMIFLPPQHGKSTLVSKYFSAYFLSKNPDKRIILGTYNYKFASTFCIDIKRILRERGYAYFGDKSTANFFDTSENGFLSAFGMRSGITGTPSDLVIIDDPTKGFEDAYSEIVREKIWGTYVYDIETREQKHTSYIIIMTRWHSDDLAARLLERDGDKWDVISMPAICDSDNDLLGRNIGDALCQELHTLERLLERKSNNATMFQALYQQKPSLDTGNILRSEHFNVVDELPGRYDYVLMSIDSAAKTKQDNDYSVILTIGVRTGRCYLLHMWRNRVVYSMLQNMINDIYQQYRASIILIEDAPVAAHLIQELSRSLPVKPVRVSTDKVLRAHMSSVVLDNNALQVYNASWNYDFFNEITGFPRAKHDDIVDALTQAINYINLAGRNSNVWDYLSS